MNWLCFQFPGRALEALQSQNHRMMEWFVLEGTFKITKFHPLLQAGTPLSSPGCSHHMASDDRNGVVEKFLPAPVAPGE